MRVGPELFLKQFNITGVVQGFSAEFYKRLHKDYEGQLTLIIYERKIKSELKNFKVAETLSLTGWLPEGTDNFHDYDFILSERSMPTTPILDIWVAENIDKLDVIFIDVHLNKDKLMEVMCIGTA